MFTTLAAITLLAQQRAGAGYFIHQSNAANTTGSSTVIDQPASNGRQERILIITQNYNPNGPSGVYNTHPVGVGFNSATNKWSIENQDRASLPTNCAFNVEVFEPDDHHFVHRATTQNTIGNTTWIGSGFLTLHPNVTFFVTPVQNPRPETPGVNAPVVYDSSPIAVVYEGSAWGIRNLNGQAIAPGSAFNVAIEPGVQLNGSGSNILAHTIKTGLRVLSNNITATPIWDPETKASSIGTWWNGTEHVLFAEDQLALGARSRFMVRSVGVPVSNIAATTFANFVHRTDSEPCLSSAASTTNHSAVKVASTGSKVVVVYSQSDSRGSRIVANYSSDNGATFGGPMVIGSGDSVIANLQMSNAGDHVLAAWTQNGEIRTVESTNGGQQFGPQISRVTAPVTQLACSSIVGSGGYVVWRTETGATKLLNVTSGATTEIFGAAVNESPTIVSRGNDVLVGITLVSKGQDIRIFESHDGGRTFVSDIIRENDSDQWNPLLVADAERVGLSWQSNELATYYVQGELGGWTGMYRPSTGVATFGINLQPENQRWIDRDFSHRNDLHPSIALGQGGIGFAWLTKMTVANGSVHQSVCSQVGNGPVSRLGDDFVDLKSLHTSWVGRTFGIVIENSGVIRSSLGGPVTTLSDPTQIATNPESAGGPEYLYVAYLQRAGDVFQVHFKRVPAPH